MAQSFGVRSIESSARSSCRAAAWHPRGFRISLSIALILVVAAEMIGAQEGIGAFVLSAGNLMQTTS